MSDIIVLDTSAVLACIHREPGGENVESVITQGGCWMTAVNTCEVLGKLCDRGATPVEAQAKLNSLELTVVPFDAELALLAAAMRVRTKSIGASLGDRACLALAERAAGTESSPIVYTAERAWSSLKWPFKIVRIR